MRAFVVSHNSVQLELRGCIFSHSENIMCSLKFRTLELMCLRRVRSLIENGSTQLCTELKPHQLTALDFLRKNESSETDRLSLWNHPDNVWLRRFVDQSGIDVTGDWQSHKSRGSILADDMGLGKTLTTLAYVLATRDAAMEFQWAEWENQSAATLVICPLATLSNWENEMKIHFKDSAFTYVVFHGPDRNKLTRKDLQSPLVVLTTYKMIRHSGKGLNPDQLTIMSMNLHWFRIVLDEAQNPTSHRTHNIQQLEAEFVLLLTGTPVQNRLTDLQSLIAMLKIAPWDQEQLWKRCLIPRMNVGAPEAIKSLTILMQAVCLRRTKAVLLNLPEKVEKAILVRNSPEWEEVSRRLHTGFIHAFGRLQTSDEPWNAADFFRQMTMMRQFCNHPIFARQEMLIQPSWRWEDSAKIIHLLHSLKDFLKGARQIQYPKAVIFSSFVAFLQIIGRALQDNEIESAWLTGDFSTQQRDQNLGRFRSDQKCHVLLASLQAAGVGIDLRCAQNVYLMEPSWNPASEFQAIDRLYCLGQINSVWVYRYYIEGSLEMNMYQVQRRKSELALLSVPTGGNEEYECAQMLMTNLIG
ncbi:hypothetical protein PTTG_03585 [Puccinia triticina 1-1 BBBD Race 1]|uniref:Helicase ATP-binding domain-containing protein n=1 Tax=Puccinia triticina (isolate 1-1 / race 1 (BBBD)) TaxID=630390 RepID=A0A180GH37_PUCT1|nr:hypothetical protein PTTG_03585 [Puccinia triticina 1-1 BBBD Race 1]